MRAERRVGEIDVILAQENPGAEDPPFNEQDRE
jgi:hypothetical protein